MHRAYLSIAANEVATASDSHMYGELSSKLPFAVEPAQRAAWIYQIDHLRKLAEELPEAYFMMEFLIPRMGRRADLIVLHHGIIFVVEYKFGEPVPLPPRLPIADSPLTANCGHSAMGRHRAMSGA